MRRRAIRRRADKLATVLAQVGEERRRQDEQWGGPLHDDHHTPRQWFGLVDDHLGRAKKAAGGKSTDHDTYRHNLVQVAALAVAAVESLDRLRRRPRRRRRV